MKYYPQFINRIYEFKDDSFGRIISFDSMKQKFKVRKIRLCVGKYSSPSRIGEPYTYQIYMSPLSLKRARLIGTEEILHILIKQEKNNQHGK